jgi:hypothetical protein
MAVVSLRENVLQQCAGVCWHAQSVPALSLHRFRSATLQKHPQVVAGAGAAQCSTAHLMGWRHPCGVPMRCWCWLGSVRAASRAHLHRGVASAWLSCIVLSSECPSWAHGSGHVAYLVVQYHLLLDVCCWASGVTSHCTISSDVCVKHQLAADTRTGWLLLLRYRCNLC